MALGRGLGELLGEIEHVYNNESNSNSSIREISIDLIDTNPHQPRKYFDEDKINELSNSIKEHGLLQPIVIKEDGLRFILIAGERRLRATKLAKIDTIKAVILDIEDNKLRELALIENIQRDDLNILEIAYSYSGLINEYDVTHEALSEIVCKSRSSITNTLRLLTLGTYAQHMLSVNKITYGHAKNLVGLNEDEQKLIIDLILKDKLSVREVEKLVKEYKISDKTELPQIKTSQVQSKFDFQSLNSVFKHSELSNLKITAKGRSIKIEFDNQEDVEQLSLYLEKVRNQ